MAFSISKPYQNTITYLASAILITMFLFFIDEGYYDFRWMADIFNWIPFVIYTVAIWTSQLLISELLLRKYDGTGKIITSIFAGAIIGFILVAVVLFG